VVLGDLRIRNNDDEIPKKEISREIVTLNENEIILNAEKAYKENINIRKEQEERMEIKEEKPEKRSQSTMRSKEKNPKQGRIDTDDEEEIDINTEEHPTLIDIIRKEEDRGFKMGNKPKRMKTRYRRER
jgi:hypothetical protein